MALIISTWRWGTKYPQIYVDRLEFGIAKHLRSPYNFMVCEPDPEDAYLLEMPGCLCRLRMFSPQWQSKRGLTPGDRLVMLDLDLVVCGSLDSLFDRSETFVIWQGANAMNPCPYNGSVMMLRCGHHSEVWDDFSLESLKAAPYFEFPDDQGWIAHKLPNAAGWRCGSSSGIYGFRKPGWPSTNMLPRDAKMVCFPGHRDPGDPKMSRFPWIRRHWRSRSESTV